jgi:hypothetical protein
VLTRCPAAPLPRVLRRKHPDMLLKNNWLRQFPGLGTAACLFAAYVVWDRIIPEFPTGHGHGHVSPHPHPRPHARTMVPLLPKPWHQLPPRLNWCVWVRAQDDHKAHGAH